MGDVVDKHRIRLRASKQYLDGEITIDAYNAIWEANKPDYRAMLDAMAKRSIDRNRRIRVERRAAMTPFGRLFDTMFNGRITSPAGQVAADGEGT